jgi:hypothetical protein
MAAKNVKIGSGSVIQDFGFERYNYGSTKLTLRIHNVGAGTYLCRYGFR